MAKKNLPIIFQADGLTHFILLPDGSVVNPQKAIAEARRRNVFIEGQTYCGSGTRLGRGLILTARHVIKNIVVKERNSKILVNKMPAEIIRWKKRPDLALLQIKDDGIPPIKMRTSITQLMPAFWCGNPLTNRHLTASCSIMGWSGSRVYITGIVQKVASGSGLYNLLGEFIGMITRDEGYMADEGALPFAISADRVLKFASRDVKFLKAAG
jgi:hypothetical protein